MKIVFMGTPEFAVPCLETCIHFEGAQVIGVFTQPDRPKGRGNKLTPPPVKAAAQKEDIPVYQPEKIKSAQAMEILKGLNPDLIVVVAYGQILSQEILDLPAYGCINVHASLLPKLRGASPIQWAIVSGENETGVTTMKMSAGLDEGDMLHKQSLKLSDTITGGALHDLLMQMGANVLKETLEGIVKGSLTPVPQDHKLSTYAPKIEKRMAEIDWERTAEEISALVRGFDPWPAGLTSLGEVKLKVFTPEVVREDSLKSMAVQAEPGVLIDVDRVSFTVKAGRGAVRFFEIQAPGARRMKVSDYLLGHSLKAGDRFN
ncbi:methionyl-tRNA formyltransferase [Acidaminobacter hydrogenoformans]|uniref:Methionyl-tRNA formyltransferase n=1 Tax=Acidaminobacter hydrogenoformans DSM 2784 TaxID=1120920 RepID=A0A1G5RSC0_9FIRM|nr:methionyl-tRNA formyltransferase [Acidaminobacter hydrogenoformans]SCZ76964.1 methionyl-tRNA formyltransferase [Acidaminobacter hydrogenoformans DSM 2784]